MPLKIDTAERHRILRWAAQLIDEPRAADAVIAAASPLIGWAEDAIDRDDQAGRIIALQMQSQNEFASDGEPCRDAGVFLGEAVKLHAYATAVVPDDLSAL